MQAGDLDQLVTIRRGGGSPDDIGEVVDALYDVASVWANVRPMSGRERLNAQKVESVSGYIITVRSGADVTEADVIDWNGVEFDVLFAKVTPRTAWIELECEKRSQ